MLNVTVVFTNVTTVSFAAQEFDADLVNSYGEGSVKKFPYKDAKGQDSAIQLRPKDVVKSPRCWSEAFRVHRVLPAKRRFF
jgi:hypothetical protein